MIYISTGSNASNNESDSDFDFNNFTDSEISSSLELSSEYETIVINRLDVIAVSCIISTCILFFLLLRSRRG